MAIFVYKELHGLHPEQNETSFRKLNELHTHNTRSVTSNTCNLFIPRGNTQSFHKTVSYSGSRLWNEIPNEIRSTQTLESFKEKYKKHLATQETQTT